MSNQWSFFRTAWAPLGRAASGLPWLQARAAWMLPLAALAALLAAGCFESEMRNPMAHPPPNAAPTPYLQGNAMQPSAPPGTGTAVDDALYWSKKYAESLEEMEKQRQQNRSLGEENQKSAAQLAKTQGDLAKAQTELAEANKLLIEVRQQVEKWKTDVLGFRDEMRKANQVQLEALAKVLSLVGAEVPKEAAPAKASEPALPDKPSAAATPTPEKPAAEAPPPAPAAAKASAPQEKSAAGTTTAKAPPAKIANGKGN
jgi:hypothetical protein